MYKVKKRIEVAGSHHLNLDYPSKCSNLHGHNWIIEVYCKSETLNLNGMVVDFTEIKNVVTQLDHANVNDILKGINPTAENIAKWICDNVQYCYKVTVQESEGNIACYEL